ncbi:hypothetical protein MRX96_032082 [Rhipicephalus microplus]
MKNGDESLFYTFYRMSPATFDVLHSLVKEKLTKDQCPSRKPISSGERLALTLRRRWAHNVKKAGVHSPGYVCNNIVYNLKLLLFQTPTEEQWREIAATQFGNSWQFPNCVEAIDGKHVQIKCPPK